MSDSSFLPYLINEEIYVIKEEKDQPTPTSIPEEQPAAQQAAEEPAEVYITPLPTLGGNLKHCIVLVESEAEILEEETKTFLANVLKAVKRSLDDVLLVNVKEAVDGQLEALLAEQNHRHLLSFGNDKLSSIASIAAYEVHQENHKYYLKAEALEAISQDQGKKKALWTALQNMFLSN